MRSKHNRAYNQTALIINGVCGLVFIAFAVHYLLHRQSGVLLLSYDMYNHSDTPFDLLKAVIISVICLVIPTLFLCRLLHLPLSAKALAWTPSFICLGLLTSLIYMDTSVMRYVMLFVITAVTTFAIVYAQSRPDQMISSRPKVMPILERNAIIIFLSIVACHTIGNNSLALHLKLNTARLVREENYDELLSSPDCVNCLVNQLLKPDDPVGTTLKIHDNVGLYLGYVPSDWSVPMDIFLREAINAEKQCDTTDNYQSVRMQRLIRFNAAIPKATIENINK